MSLLRNVARGLRSLLRKKRVGEELDEELDGFLEMAAEEKIKQGMSRKEALRAVRLERALSGKLRDESSPTIYVPYLQNVQQLDEMTFEVRTEGNPTQWTAAVRQAVRELDRNLPLFDIKTQTKQIEQASFQERLFSRLSSFFGLLALALTCVGLYGMTSYAVARRTNEIGIRMAMGATRVEVLALIVSQRLRLTLIGVGAGIVGALGLTHFLSTLLYGVKPNDPLTFTVVSLILTGMALIASYIPARRATRVDPLVALRYE